MTANISQLIDDYLAAYSDPDRARRSDLVARVWARDGQLIDPPLESRGHEGIAAQAAALQTQFPGHRFRRSTSVDAHHGFARYDWQLADVEGKTILEGSDFAEIDAEDRLQRVVGFFGPMPIL